MLCWLDIESTGLDETHDAILEIALATTDDNLNILAENSWLCTEHLYENLGRMSPQVHQMHLDSGLLFALNEVGDTSDFVGDWRHQVMDWLDNVAYNAVSVGQLDVPPTLLPPYRKLLNTIPLAGSTVSFDRRFLRFHFPDLDGLFHYRSVDVSSIKELVNRWYAEDSGRRWPSPEKKPHRALADVHASIDELKHYRQNVFIP